MRRIFQIFGLALSLAVMAQAQIIKTNVYDVLTNSGTPLKGTVTFFLVAADTTAVYSPNGLIVKGASITVALNSAGRYDVALWPSASLSPESYYVAYYAAPNTVSRTWLGLYSIPVVVTTTPRLISPYLVTNVDKNLRFVFASELSVQSLGGGTAAVTSVHGRTGAVVAASNDYTFAQLASKPTTLAGYGIADAAAASHAHPASGISDSTTVGRALLTASDAAAQRTALGLASVASSGAYSSLSGLPTLGTAAALNVPASGDAFSGQVVKGSDTRLSDARVPLTHTHISTAISDSTTVGRALLVASDAAAQRTAIALASTDTVNFAELNLVKEYTSVGTGNIIASFTVYGGAVPRLLMREADGPLSAPVATASGRTIFSLQGRGYDGSNFSAIANGSIGIIAAETFTPSAQGTQLTFNTMAVGSVSLGERLRIASNGYTGINQISPTAQLHVNSISTTVAAGIFQAASGAASNQSITRENDGAGTQVGGRYVDGSLYTPLTTPGSPTNNTFWIDCTGTSPSRVCAIKVRDAGTTRTIGSITF